MPKVEKLTLQIPPNSLFQPISTDYKNNLTFTEFLLGVLKKLNEMVDSINYCEEFIENYDGEIEKLQRDLVLEINALRDEMMVVINSQISILRRYVNDQDQEIYNYIDSILVGDILVYNPINGYQEPLQDVINALYDIERTDALTATEYDALELTATAYAAYDLTATQYDMQGKTLLV